LNGYEYYDEMFKKFCNQVDHDRSQNIDPEERNLKLPETHNTQTKNGAMALENYNSNARNNVPSN
jgi:hypothetical protein